MKRVALVVMMSVVVLFGAATVYDVELSDNDNFTAREASQSFLATADSISKVVFFCGRKIIPGRYVFSIKDSLGGDLPDNPTAFSDSAGLYDYDLVSATFNSPVYVKKGFRYRLHIQHQQPDQYHTNFYYNSNDPYPDGQLIGHPDSHDLAARIKGVNDFPGNIFGVHTGMTITLCDGPPNTLRWPEYWQPCIDSMQAMGIKWERTGICGWQHFQFDSVDIDTFHHAWFDTLMTFFAQDSINVLWYFFQCTQWSKSNNKLPEHWYRGFPKNLFEPVFLEGDIINKNNYFGQYVYEFVRRYGPDGAFWNENPGLPYLPIKYYEMWNEPEWTIRDGAWDMTHITYPLYDSLIHSMGQEASLIYVYARLCKVGYLAARQAAVNNGCSAESIRTLIYVPYHWWASSGHDDYWPPPADWLSGLDSLGVQDSCDGMAFHTYVEQESLPPSASYERQKINLDSLWIFIKNNGSFADKFLWCTEHNTGMWENDWLSFSDSLTRFKTQADVQLETAIRFITNDAPEGPLTHSFLFGYTSRYQPDTFFSIDSCAAWGSQRYNLTRDDMSCRPPGFGYRQMTSLLADCRFNQNLVADSILRVYEFEDAQTDRRVYVGWRERDVGESAKPFKLPLRTNAGKVDSIAYDGSPGTYLADCDNAGWLSLTLDTVPIYVQEPIDSALRRPDLVIDSIWTDPAYPRDSDSVTVYARLRNIDTIQATLDTIFVHFLDSGDTLATDTILVEIAPESTLISSPDIVWMITQGIHLLKAVVNPERKFVEHDFSNNAQYRLYDVPLRPYGSIKINNDSCYTNLVFVALTLNSVNPNDSLNPPADSMKLWQIYREPPDTNIEHIVSTGWISYDIAYCWYLRQGQNPNVIYAQYKVGAQNESFTYCDTIIFDKTAPTGYFVIDDDSTFTNTSMVTLTNYLADTRSGLSQMRYGNKQLKNIVVNSAFDNPESWEYDDAIYHDSLGLFEIPVTTSGSYFYQPILPESLAAFDDDTILLWLDLVSDSFSGNGQIEFQYILDDPDSVDPLGYFTCGAAIAIPQGTKAHASHYNLCSLFVYNEPTVNWSEARIGVFVRGGAQNKGRLYIDNFRLDVVSPHDDYTVFEDFDSTKLWALASGNGVRKAYGQFADGAGNETAVLWDSIIVDTTKPLAAITSPQDDQVLSGNVGITGYAFDCADPVQHFKEYDLYYRQNNETENWYGICPDSIFYDPVDSSTHQVIAKWNTKQVTEYHGDGWYYLRLTVSDLASNYRRDSVLVYIRNDRGEKGEIAGFSNDVYGLAAENEIFVGELGTGKIYRYNSNYQLLDTFALIDSLGIGLPLAMALDDSGKLWVTNIVSHYVNRFTPQGNLLLQFAGGFSLPSGIALDETGNEWISDRLHHKLKKFDSQGNLLCQFGTRGRDSGEIDRPIGVASYSSMLYVADSRNRRISIFDTLGSFVRVIGDSAGLVMPFGLVVDSTGCVFVSDILGNQVIEFGPSGNRLFGIDSILDSPTGLALSSDMKTLYISDTRNRRVLAYAIREEPPLGGGGPQAMSEVDINKLAFDIYPSPFSSRLTIKLQGMAGNKLTLKLYDVTGRLIKTFFDNNLVKYDQNMIWDGHDNQQRKCAAGVYFLRLEIGDYKDTRKTILMK